MKKSFFLILVFLLTLFAFLFGIDYAKTKKEENAKNKVEQYLEQRYNNLKTIKKIQYDRFRNSYIAVCEGEDSDGEKILFEVCYTDWKNEKKIYWDTYYQRLFQTRLNKELLSRIKEFFSGTTKFYTILEDERLILIDNSLKLNEETSLLEMKEYLKKNFTLIINIYLSDNEEDINSNNSNIREYLYSLRRGDYIPENAIFYFIYNDKNISCIEFSYSELAQSISEEMIKSKIRDGIIK